MQRKLQTAQGKATSLQSLSEGAGSTDKTVKKYAKAKKDVSNIEQKLLKNNETLAKYNHDIEETQAEIPVKDKEIADAAQKVEDQTALVASLNQKHDAIK